MLIVEQLSLSELHFFGFGNRLLERSSTLKRDEYGPDDGSHASLSTEREALSKRAKTSCQLLDIYLEPQTHMAFSEEFSIFM